MKELWGAAASGTDQLGCSVRRKSGRWLDPPGTIDDGARGTVSRQSNTMRWKVKRYRPITGTTIALGHEPGDAARMTGHGRAVTKTKTIVPMDGSGGGAEGGGGGLCVRAHATTQKAKDKDNSMAAWRLNK